MKTNEEIKRALLLQAEETIEGLLWQVRQITEGNFQELEHQVLSAVGELGRKCLEGLIEQSSGRRNEPARRVGACGHRQRLVSTRPRQLLPLLGPITFHRGYYHCLSKREQARTEAERCCPHGEIPFDQHWGIDQHRSSPGPQRAVSYVSASLTQEEMAEAGARLLPWQISARQVGHVAHAVGKAFQQWEDRRVHEAMQEDSQKQTSEAEQQEKRKEPLKRLYVAMDGVMVRVHRGSVPMEKVEQELCALSRTQAKGALLLFVRASSGHKALALPAYTGYAAGDGLLKLFGVLQAHVGGIGGEVVCQLFVGSVIALPEEGLVQQIPPQIGSRQPRDKHLFFDQSGTTVSGQRDVLIGTQLALVENHALDVLPTGKLRYKQPDIRLADAQRDGLLPMLLLAGRSLAPEGTEVKLFMTIQDRTPGQILSHGLAQIGTARLIGNQEDEGVAIPALAGVAIVQQMARSVYGFALSCPLCARSADAESPAWHLLGFWRLTGRWREASEPLTETDIAPCTST